MRRIIERVVTVVTTTTWTVTWQDEADPVPGAVTPRAAETEEADQAGRQRGPTPFALDAQEVDPS